jgi:hypothetical protein
VIILYPSKILFGKLEGKRPLRRPRHRWENNIKIDLKGIKWVASSCEHGSERLDSIKA